MDSVGDDEELEEDEIQAQKHLDEFVVVCGIFNVILYQSGKEKI